MLEEKKTICSVLILNYNGKSLLREYLPSVISEAQESKYGCEVVVVDNQSLDDSVEFVKANYPGVKIIRTDQNLFLISYNDALRQIESPYVILLNNDIRPARGFIDSILDYLKTPGVFAVESEDLRQLRG